MKCCCWVVVSSIVALEVYLTLRDASWAVEVIVVKTELRRKVLATSVWAC